jgi:SAM-dependent methyltransferase
MARRMLYVAGEQDPLHLHALRNRFLRTPNVTVQKIDPEAAEDLAGLERCFDTVLCLNVLEHIEDPGAVLARLERTLKPGGRLVVLVPNVPALYGTLDQRLGHKRRYAAESARGLLETQGFRVESARSFNKVALLPWWAYSRVLHAGNIGKLVLKIFDKSVWFWRRLDPVIPLPGLSLLVVARKPGDGSAAAPSMSGRETAHNAN